MSSSKFSLHRTFKPTFIGLERIKLCETFKIVVEINIIRGNLVEEHKNVFWKILNTIPFPVSFGRFYGNLTRQILQFAILKLNDNFITLFSFLFDNNGKHCGFKFIDTFFIPLKTFIFLYGCT